MVLWRSPSDATSLLDSGDESHERHMTRIIGGSAKGRRLRTPTGGRTRPTADRVREALFSAVEAANGTLSGLRFLDLYAGSGAVGLEALSRGASFATLVEHDRRAVALIRENTATLEFRAEVVTATVTRALRDQPTSAYDVAFLDPPYTLGLDHVLGDLAALTTNHWLAPDALVVVERSTRERELTWPEGYVAQRSKKYGETTLWYGRATGPTAAV